MPEAFKAPKAFKKFTEMAYENGITQDGSSGEHEWNNRNERFVSVLREKLPMKMKFQKYSNRYYLTTEDDKYIGFVEIDENKITRSHRNRNALNLQGYGFYQVILPLIISEIGQIQSDRSLSRSAIYSYSKLAKSRLLDIKLSDGSKFSVERLLANPKIRVVLESYPNFPLDDLLEDYYEKINQIRFVGGHQTDGDYKKMYISNDPVLFTLVFDLEPII
jgi:hypothetical protein